MTLDTTPRYESEQVAQNGDHAVIVGGSMAGLMAARVLADGFRTVTVIERDPLPNESVARRGTPQAEHIHLMHEGGRQTLEDFFPGYSADLTRNGAVLIDMASDLQMYAGDGLLANGSKRIPMYLASRALFELITRRHVSDFEGVTLRDECQVTEYCLTDGGETVEGVTIRNEVGDSETIPAELVVDATGRASRTPTWLEEHGYEPPPRDEVKIDLMYGTIKLERPPDDRRMFNVLPSPPRQRGGGVVPIEDGEWGMTLYGLHGDHPPGDVDGFAEFAAEYPLPELKQLIDEHEVLSESVTRYPYPGSSRRRYWDLNAFPDGLLVVGDAIASFNPIYAQGMTISALQALQLHHTLAKGSDDLASRFFDRVESVIGNAWDLAVRSDFQFSETTGPKPTGTDLLNRYQSRLLRKAQTDEKLAETFARVAGLEEPVSALLRPSVVWRALKPTGWPLRSRSTSASTSRREQRSSVTELNADSNPSVSENGL